MIVYGWGRSLGHKMLVNPNDNNNAKKWATIGAAKTFWGRSPSVGLRRESVGADEQRGRVTGRLGEQRTSRPPLPPIRSRPSPGDGKENYSVNHDRVLKDVMTDVRSVLIKSGLSPAPSAEDLDHLSDLTSLTNL